MFSKHDLISDYLFEINGYYDNELYVKLDSFYNYINKKLMCTKMIQHSARQIGKTYKSKCDKPEYKNGLCKHHYDLSISKQTNWIDRPNYRAATQEDLDKQRSLKLKNSNEHKLFMCQHGIMKEYSKKESKYVQSDISADYTLFCVLVF